MHLLKFSDESEYSFARCNLKWYLEKKILSIFVHKQKLDIFQIQGL